MRFGRAENGIVWARRLLERSAGVRGRSAGVLALALAVLAAGGCSGSGSSGFDFAPTSEAEAIRQAMDETSCVDFAGTSFCGTGAPVPLGDGAATIELEDGTAPLTCEARPGVEGCETSVAFASDGFPAGTSYLAAYGETEDGPWTLSTTVPGQIDGSPGSTFDVSLVLAEAGTEALPRPLLVAVLVYVGPVPDDPPAQAASLGAFGADVVYVSPELAVQSAEGGGSVVPAV